MHTASSPLSTDVAFVQLVTRLPAALPTGTRPEPMAPITVPSMNGGRTEKSEKAVSMIRRSRQVSIAECSA